MAMASSSAHKKIILDNIDSLSQNTNCSEEFLRKCVASYILSENEVELIKNGNVSKERSSQFYVTVSAKDSATFKELYAIMTEESVGSPEAIKILSAALEKKKKSKGVKFHDGSDEII